MALQVLYPLRRRIVPSRKRTMGVPMSALVNNIEDLKIIASAPIPLAADNATGLRRRDDGGVRTGLVNCLPLVANLVHRAARSTMDGRERLSLARPAA